MEVPMAATAPQDVETLPVADSNGIKDPEAPNDVKDVPAIDAGEPTVEEPALQPEDDVSYHGEEESANGSDDDKRPAKDLTEWTEAMNAGLASFKTVEDRLSKCLEALDLKDNVKRLEAAVEMHQRKLAKLRKLVPNERLDDEPSDHDRNSRSRSRSPSTDRSRSTSSSTTNSIQSRRHRRVTVAARPSSPSWRRYPMPSRVPAKDKRRSRSERPHARSIPSNLGASRLVVTTRSIPKLFYAPWEKVVLGPLQSVPYHSVEIPYNEPSSTDLLQISAERPMPDSSHIPMPPPRMSAYADSITDSDEDRVEHSFGPPEEAADVISYSAPEFLTERIRINSFYLQSLLTHDLIALAPNSLSNTGPLHILRPFKVLWDIKDRIRARIREFELARSRLGQLSEDEYNAELESAQWLDIALAERVAEYTASRVALTSFILELRCLDDFNTNILEPEVARISRGPDTIRFSELWFLFAPGTLVVSKDKRIPQKVWKVVERSGGRWNHGNVKLKANDAERVGYSPFRVDCFYIDYDGNRFVPIWSHFVISEFEGTQETTKLNVVPIDLLAGDRDAFDKAATLERGQQFLESCAKPCHRYYTGRSHRLTPKGTKLAPTARDLSFPRSATGHVERIESEIIIDFAKAIEEVPFWLPPDELFDSPEIVVLENGRYVGQEGTVLNDRKWNKAATDAFLAAEERKWRVWNTTGPGPSGDDLLLLPDRVFAFVLRTRKWACLPIGKDSDGNERLQVIKPRPEPWNELELPEGHKDVVQSLIDSHFSRDKTRKMHLDVVRDKGKGVIILLHGVPGVGKTSTAVMDAPCFPSLAVYYPFPSHNVQKHAKTDKFATGDLGLGPNEVEFKLQEIFRLAHSWNCVLLLDEADIFLAQRTTPDIHRNALVSVFLRVLEYYEGILFLTTNRVGTFDEAFKSRIHMSLYYPPLNGLQTSKIWKTNIKKVQENGIEIDSKAILQYAKRVWEGQQISDRGPVWNGRQIRNAFQSAIALAGFHGAPQGGPVRLEEKYFESVNRVSEQFSQYIFKTRHGQTDADWHRMSMTRRDDFAVNSDGFGQSMAVAVPRPTPQFQGHQTVPVAPPPQHMANQYGQPLYSGYSYPNAQPSQMPPPQQQQPPHQVQHHQPPAQPFQQPHQQPQQQNFQQPLLTAPFPVTYPAQPTVPGAPPQPNFASQPTDSSPWE
ncbi:AAA family ATPase [Colletotrichum sojae]|uniref:AAA family ATPase n=1 Tax=Colletotrichum sojae TaxID=2175907 RepID=A0A8H6J018_9PEZI|nr:AAA family ATPase [Colletotrichum sojae]